MLIHAFQLFKVKIPFNIQKLPFYYQGEQGDPMNKYNISI